MKIFTFYLPQFHTIPENDEWWGKDFTEWVNVKKAKPLFENHNQPRVPLNNYYYDLLKPETIKNQAILAKKYGVSGFCFYHYYFNGKLLLEKPLENFLNDKTIDLEFCLCWPNESWTRTWSGNSEEILIKQDYGNQKNWEKHYNYLSKFFKDKRYQRLDNKPVFIIYGTSYIPNLTKFLDYFNNLAKKDGFEGIYFVKVNSSCEEFENRYKFDGYIEFEPYLTISEKSSKFSFLKKFVKIGSDDFWNKIIAFHKKIKGFLPIKYKPNIINYDEIYAKIIDRKSDQKTFLGAFPGWDNSPRKNTRATIVTDSSPEKFKNYLSKQINKAVAKNSELIFINAWNEWGEGAYLEPDEQNKYEYLEAVKKALLENNF
jgi:lipopolysaccharide biosynthesis protein